MAAGALGQVGVQSIGQSIGYGIGREQQSDSYHYWKKSLKSGPRYAAIGLERAGLNRILALGGGVGASTAGSQTKANAAGMGGTGTNASQAAASAKALSAQAALTGTQQEIAEAQLVYERGRAELYSTGPGKGLIEAEAYLKSLPSTLTGAAIRGGTKALQWLREASNARETRTRYERTESPLHQDNDGNWRDDGGNKIPTLTIRPKGSR